MEMIVSGCNTGDHEWAPVQVSEASWLWVRNCEDCKNVDVDYIRDQVYSRMEKNRREMRHLSVYRCGLGYDFRNAWFTFRRGKDFQAAVYVLKRAGKRLWGDTRARRWQAVRNQFKGWMAEPYMDGGVTWHRCGVGWTRSGAVRSFHRRQAKHWLKDHPQTPYRGDDECAHCQIRY